MWIVGRCPCRQWCGAWHWGWRFVKSSWLFLDSFKTFGWAILNWRLISMSPRTDHSWISNFSCVWATAHLTKSGTSLKTFVTRGEWGPKEFTVSNSQLALRILSQWLKILTDYRMVEAGMSICEDLHLNTYLVIQMMRLVLWKLERKFLLICIKKGVSYAQFANVTGCIRVK